MTTFEAALAAWIAFHSELGVNIEATFMPPATESELVAAERAIGFSLPDDLRSLYKVANGQYDTYYSKALLEERLGPNEYWAPLFGYYQLLPLEQAVSRHIRELESRESRAEYIEKYNEANPKKPLSEQYESWDVREGDVVDPGGWNHSWFIFAEGNADNIAIDMNPPHGGVPGQIVEFGPDLAQLSVLGSSLINLLEVASYRLSPDEAGRYQRNAPDEESIGTVYFDIDWRNKPYDEQEYIASNPVFPEEYQQWQEDLERKSELRAQRFVDWLIQQGLDESDVFNVSNIQRSNLNYIVDFEDMPDHVFQAMNAWSIARGSGPFSTGPEPDDEAVEQAIWYRYLMGLASEVLSSTEEHSKHISSTIGDGLLREDAIELIHQYYLESRQWTAHRYETVKAFSKEVRNLNIVKVGEASNRLMEIVGTVLKICYSTFDSESYKSEDYCDRVDLDIYQRD